ncbi:MAG TPA: septal ring lytic transglycosylase RlpA family protein [Flavipsychrobacter sp.]|nr:septal ring lytic transglycosylase RlpA family protein [Flavipsychrobacter sp.]
MRLILITTILFFTGLGLRAQQIVKHITADKKGVASYYHHKFEGRKTATGEIFNNSKYTAACNRLKLGSYVRVTNLGNGRVVYVRINDRMAATNNRLIDLASIAAEKLDFKDDGLTKVKIEIVPAVEGKFGILAQNGLESAPKTTL